MGVKQFTAQQFIDAIRGIDGQAGSGGIITTIAKRVGCDWHTAKKYITEFATVRQAYEDECNHMGDALESKAAAIAMQGDGPMLRFLLSTKWKDRGYTERQEHSGPDGGPIEFDVEDWKRKREERRKQVEDIDGGRDGTTDGEGGVCR